MAEEKPIGKVTHYFDKIGVAVVEITDGKLSVGDTIKIIGHDNELEQVITSMQIDREEIANAKTGQAVGLKVDSQVKEKDLVYKVS